MRHCEGAHLRTDAVVISPVVVTDAPAMAGILAAVVALTPRQLRDLVRERGIPHATWHRHVYARVEDVVLALGLAGREGPVASPRAEWSEEEIVARAARGGRR